MLRLTKCIDILIDLLACSSGNLKLVANNSINKSIHVVDLNINRYDMIVVRELIRSLGLTAMALT